MGPGQVYEVVTLPGLGQQLPARRDLDPLPWSSRAACPRYPRLPWTADPWHTTAGQERLMRRVCTECPVNTACAQAAASWDATAGFWAGRWHQPPPRAVARQLPLPGLTADAS
ncbi:MAG TPA: WhiB family transcriptional regulator [Dermatophilaceae bacterium]|nr:WhiB family transcriptional regulator [Dermatophilaceae bacterium]